MKSRSNYIFYKTLSIVLATLLLFSVIFCVLIYVKSSDDEHKNPEFTETLNTETEKVPSLPDTTELEELKAQVADLMSKLDEYEMKYTALEVLVQKYSESASNNFAVHADSTAKLLEFIKNENRPLRTHKTDGDEDPKKTVANLGFVYTDLETGYTFTYNAEEVVYAASIIKAPYIYSILTAVEEFEYQKKNFDHDGNALYDEDGQPLFEGRHPNLNEDGSIKYLKDEEKYDLSRVWTYDKKTMYCKGSGVIQNEKDGFQLTYIELCAYALEHSDNIAFGALTDLFGVDIYYETAEKLGCSGYKEGFMQLSAGDTAKFFTELYNYMEDGGKYAVEIKDAMTNSHYPVMLPAAFNDKKLSGGGDITVAHKYGWDEGAYHDAAIVYDDHPFSVVVFTDLDSGTSTDYLFIRNIGKLLHEIHREFYLDSIYSQE